MDRICNYPGCNKQAHWHITLIIPKNQSAHDQQEIEMAKYFCDDHKGCVERERLPSGFWQAVIQHHAKDDKVPGA